MANELLLTTKGTVTFPQVFTPASFNGGKAKYSINLLFSEADMADPKMVAIKKAVKEMVYDIMDVCDFHVVSTNKSAEAAEAFGMSFPRGEWMKKAFEHQTHHRGQCTIYLRMAGIAPPPEKLF